MCVVRGAAGSRVQTQTTEFKGMALDRVPRKVGIVGYGRLGESLTVWGLSSRSLSGASKACVLHQHSFHLCLDLWPG